MHFKPVDELTIADDFLFCEIMKNKEIAIGILERLLKMKISDIQILTTQKEIRGNYDNKSVRLDFYGEDENRVYDVELQVLRKPDLEIRARYYQAMMDCENLKKGDEYRNLKQSYVIFICMFPLLKSNLPVYTFVTKCLEEEYRLNDKRTIIFYNVNGFKTESDKNLKALLEYFKTQKPLDKWTSDLSYFVTEVKESKSFRSSYMTLEMKFNEMKEEIYKSAIKRGAKNNAKKTAKSLLALNSITVEQIASATGLSLREVEKIQSKLVTKI